MGIIKSKNNLFKLLSINKTFSKGHKRSVRAKKNILASIIIKGLGIMISLILVPLTLQYINPTEYGIWITLSSIIGWFGFFDIGFGNGLRNKFAESVALGKHKLARIYVSTTYVILSIIIAFVLLLFIFINPLLNWSKILNTSAGMENELSILALIVFIFFCLRFVLQLIITVITANQQPAKGSLFDLIGGLISLIVIFILTKTTSGNLIYLGIVLGSTPILVLSISSIWLYSNEYRRYAPSISFVKFSYARDLMSLGIKFFALQIAVVIIYQTSNIIISQLFGPSQVTSYNIAYKYFSVIPMFFGIITMPFWSAFTEAWANNDIDWIKNIMQKLKLFWIIISLITIVMLVFANFIYRIWVGKEIIVSLGISIIMAAYVITNAWCTIYSQFLNGIGKIKLQLYSGLFSALINIPLAIYLGRNIGISGVVLSTFLLALISAIWSPIQYNKLINNNAKGIWNK